MREKRSKKENDEELLEACQRQLIHFTICTPASVCHDKSGHLFFYLLRVCVCMCVCVRMYLKLNSVLFLFTEFRGTGE